MLIREAYYIGTSVHSFRSGEPAKIIGVKTFYREDLHPVVCFNIVYGDGKEDWCPVSDFDNYKLLADNEIRNGYTEVQKGRL